MFIDKPREPVQNLHAVARRHFGPDARLIRLPGNLHGAIDIGGRTFGHFGQWFVIGRIIRHEASARGRIDVVPVDK